MSHAIARYDFTDKAADYARLARDLEALLAGEQDLVANAANTSALLYAALPRINWAGFYFARGEELVVGPFQGKPACVRIAFGRGVCGTAAADRRTVVVHNVDEFSGHIACDSASRSEIVVPLLACAAATPRERGEPGAERQIPQRLIGVLDLDSPQIGRFDDVDRHGLERIAQIFVESLG